MRFIKEIDGDVIKIIDTKPNIKGEKNLCARKYKDKKAADRFLKVANRNKKQKEVK